MSQSSDVISKLRTMILNLNLGPGEPVTERWAEVCFKASRTPVRSAFQKLEAEGLLQRDGKRWVVTPIKIEDLKQLYYYRETLEIAALKCAANQITNEKIELLDELTHALPHEETDFDKDLGTQFHLTLASFGENKYLEKGLKDVLLQLYRVRWLEMSSDNPALNEHHLIISALKNKDINKASELLTMHLRESCERLIKTISSKKRSLRASGFDIE